MWDLLTIQYFFFTFDLLYCNNERKPIRERERELKRLSYQILKKTDKKISNKIKMKMKSKH